MVVRLSDRVEVEWFKQVSTIQIPKPDEIAVSGIGTIAAARITPRDGEPFVAVSMYARWMWPYQADRTPWTVGHPDASAHRIISDLSVFIGNTDPDTHRIVAAGDLNMVYGDPGDYPQSLTARERTVFDRMAALGLEFMGPQHPHGRQADPRPAGLPTNTGNVPTFRPPGKSPGTALHQLDYVFASLGQARYRLKLVLIAVGQLKDGREAAVYGASALEGRISCQSQRTCPSVSGPSWSMCALLAGDGPDDCRACLVEKVR